MLYEWFQRRANITRQRSITKMATKLTNQLLSIKDLISHLTASVMGKKVSFRVERDNKHPTTGRIFIQCTYETKCTITIKIKTWHGRKWYLSDYMTEDEIVKTCYAAFKATVEHEMMEGFKCDGKRIFNPHIDYRSLLSVSTKEIYRKPKD